MEVQYLLKHTLLNSANTELVGRFKNLHKFLTTFLLKKKNIKLILFLKVKWRECSMQLYN